MGDRHTVKKFSQRRGKKKKKEKKKKKKKKRKKKKKNRIKDAITDQSLGNDTEYGLYM